MLVNTFTWLAICTQKSSGVELQGECSRATVMLIVWQCF